MPSTQPCAATSTRRRATALLLSPVVASTAVLAMASPASALVPAADTVSLNGNEFPAYFQDQSGLRLKPCLDAAQCAGTTTASVVAPDGEFFYNLMEGEVALNGGGTMRVIIGLEGAFADPGGTPEVFSRIRFVARGAAANTTYTIDHPYGDNAVVETDGRGRGRFSEDTICGAAPANCGPANFITAAGDSAADGFVGDGVTEQAITGGRRDFVSVSGGGSTVTQRAFVVTGAVADGTTPPTPQPGPAKVPLRPAKPVAAPGVRGDAGITASVNWTAPGDGGAAITQYSVQAFRVTATGRAKVGQPVVVPGDRTQLSMTFTRTGRYRFQVMASNRVGDSALSPLSNIVQGL